ncbi:WhiB family transcriptional regulator [Kitasatospora sp. NBC_01250]|uniref:WhiB family transcriptional regulator n=1 Tax=Kitasatospora sp. NBC_01250 TaxID=2903571 RepID=UPI002E30FA52|nr:WhiB family transcriptional regulator [Kitasatospora sp. NBC_01250]
MTTPRPVDGTAARLLRRRRPAARVATALLPRFLAARPDVAYPRLRGDEPCRRRDVNPDVFWPKGADALARTATAKRLCWACRPTTRAECLRWALANPVLAGEAIWAGLTEPERRAEASAAPATSTAPTI